MGFWRWFFGIKDKKPKKRVEKKKKRVSTDLNKLSGMIEDIQKKRNRLETLKVEKKILTNMMKEYDDIDDRVFDNEQDFQKSVLRVETVLKTISDYEEDLKRVDASMDKLANDIKMRTLQTQKDLKELKDNSKLFKNIEDKLDIEKKRVKDQLVDIQKRIDKIKKSKHAGVNKLLSDSSFFFMRDDSERIIRRISGDSKEKYVVETEESTGSIPLEVPKKKKKVIKKLIRKVSKPVKEEVEEGVEKKFENKDAKVVKKVVKENKPKKVEKKIEKSDEDEGPASWATPKGLTETEEAMPEEEEVEDEEEDEELIKAYKGPEGQEEDEDDQPDNWESEDREEEEKPKPKKGKMAIKHDRKAEKDIKKTVKSIRREKTSSDEVIDEALNDNYKIEKVYDESSHKSNVETEIDKLLKLVRQKGKVSFSKIAKIYDEKSSTVEAWAEALEEQGFVEIVYPLIGSPYIKLKKE